MDEGTEIKLTLPHPEDVEKETWKPGRYEDIDNEIYHQNIHALNMSTLKHMDTSPAHCFEALTNADVGAKTPQQTANLDLGSAIHTAILEPDLFVDAYHVHPKGNKNSNDYKVAAGELRMAGWTLLSQKDIDTCNRITEKIQRTPSAARDLIRAASATEVSYVIEGPFGIPCKVRPDLEVEEAGIIVDLKSTRSAKRYEFERQMEGLGYHLSVPWYMDNLERHAPGKWTQHMFLCVEKEPPYEFAIFTVKPDALALAQREVDRLYSDFAKCLLEGSWPGYPREVQSVGVPQYAHTKAKTEATYRGESK